MYGMAQSTISVCFTYGKILKNIFSLSLVEKSLEISFQAQSYLRRQLYPYRKAWVLAFTHQSFNYGIQSTQRVKVYNVILKKSLNGTSSLIEVVSIIKQHLMRELQLVRFNEINGELPRVMHATYRDHYFIAIDEACTKFLIPAIQKLQWNQMDQCPHYQAYYTDLEFELQQQAHIKNIDKLNIPKGMFSEDLYDEMLIELTKLVDSIGNIKELWIVSRIDQQKHYFIVFFGNASHWCTCLTLVNCGIIYHHFFAILLESEIAQFHIGILAKHWFNDRVMLKNDDYSNECAISIRSGGKFGAFENNVQVDFSLIDLIHGQCIFTPKIQHHIRSHALYGKGFGLMKRTLNLAIQTGCTEELYELHQQFINEIEKQLAEQEGCILQSDDEYNYETINNPLKPRT
ncbi:9269_t:CDS:2, partial [Cetraspora pellucida]